MNWQPIETAAKNNSGVIGWFPGCRCSFSMVWDECQEKWWAFGGIGSLEDHGKPTHWMPLPEGPK